MKAVILAAGYATRLYPLTLNRPKALLPIAGRPIIDYIVDELNSVSVVDEIHVVTNHKFAQHFEEWAKNVKSLVPVKVTDDGTLTEETRRGAIGDMAYVVEHEKIDDELFVIAGDNFFSYKLKDYYEFYKSKNADTICVKKIEDKSTLSSYAIVCLKDGGLVSDIEEKPKNPKSDIAAFAAYIYKKETVKLIFDYLKEGNNPDAPGHFPEWLYKKKDVYAFEFKGECYDIGTPESYQEVCAKYGK